MFVILFFLLRTLGSAKMYLMCMVLCDCSSYQAYYA